MVMKHPTVGAITFLATIILCPTGFAQSPNPSDLFKQLDKNGDGVVKSDEVPDEKKQIFNRLLRMGDKNKDNKLTQAEIVAALSTRGDASPRADETPGRQTDGSSGGGGQQPSSGRPGQRGGGFGQGGVGGQGGSRFGQGGQRGVGGQRGAGGRGGMSLTPDSIFARFDTNKDGVLTVKEIPQQAQRLLQMMQAADKNRNGEISKQELTQYLSNAGGPGGRPPGPGQRPGGGRGRASVEVGQSLPNLTAYTADGKEFALSNLKGGYSVVVFGCLT